MPLSSLVLGCSFHYGHPDVFDKLYFMSRGGVSKASKAINLSEDIFAGYNTVSLWLPSFLASILPSIRLQFWLAVVLVLMRGQWWCGCVHRRCAAARS
jgi:hypothetical protein